MKITSLLSTAALALVLSTSLSGFAADKKAATPTESEIIAQARANYPLKTCLVSDESLGSMGDAVAYIHRVAGQPDRVDFFCSGGCTDDFKANPAKFLAKVDAAAKAKK
jgi:hypothetical protein